MREKIVENAQKHGILSAKLNVEKENLQKTKKMLLNN